MTKSMISELNKIAQFPAKDFGFFVPRFTGKE